LRPQNHMAAETRHDMDTTPDAAELTTGQLVQQLPDPDADVHQAAVVNIEAARVRRFVRSLPMLERKVIAARYGLTGEPLSCRQVGVRLGLSRSTVSDIEQRALQRLRGMYDLPDAA